MSEEKQLNQLQKVEVTAELDRSARNVLEFLMSKYPPSRHKIVDSDISSKIPEMRRHLEPQYDILSNAGVNFRVEGLVDYTKEIKKFINKLIKETKGEFPRFR